MLDQELLPEDDFTGVDDVPAAGEQDPVLSQEPAAEPGADPGQAAAAGVDVQPDKTEQAFAKRLAAEIEKREREYSPYRNFIETEAARYNMTPAQYLQAVEQQRQQEEAERFAEQSGLNPEVARQLMTAKQELEQLKQRDFLRDVQSRNTHQKAELRDKPFFADLEAEIDAITAKNPNVDVATAFNYLRGQRVDELVEKARKEAEQKVLADLKLKQKGRVQPGNANSVQPRPQHGSLRDALTAAAGEIEDW